jgi:hypothetical protein
MSHTMGSCGTHLLLEAFGMLLWPAVCPLRLYSVSCKLNALAAASGWYQRQQRKQQAIEKQAQQQMLQPQAFTCRTKCGVLSQGCVAGKSLY